MHVRVYECPDGEGMLDDGDHAVGLLAEQLEDHADAVGLTVLTLARVHHGHPGSFRPSHGRLRSLARGVDGNSLRRSISPVKTQASGRAYGRTAACL
ncbi:hypothetical protein GCM10022262_26480 [Georgenia daeguensis]|uniref:Uncharacterized protein n=1 Tax=Georgenia daeguensis TaxID=908355 RepID=A0ABP8EWC7_9MICO